MPKKTFLRLDADKQERIVRAAIDEFHANGFEKAKIGTIADNAGVAKGSIYQYFEDKKELFLYAVTWSMEYFMEKIDRRTPLKDMDPFDYLTIDGRGRAETLKHETILLLFYQDIYSGKFGELTKTVNEELWKIGDEYIRHLIAVGKEKGTVRSDLDDEILALFYKGVTSQLDEYVFREISKANFELSEDKFEEIAAIKDKVILLIREGMGC